MGQWNSCSLGQDFIDPRLSNPSLKNQPSPSLPPTPLSAALFAVWKDKQTLEHVDVDRSRVRMQNSPSDFFLQGIMRLHQAVVDKWVAGDYPLVVLWVGLHGTHGLQT